MILSEQVSTKELFIFGKLLTCIRGTFDFYHLNHTGDLLFLKYEKHYYL